MEIMITTNTLIIYDNFLIGGIQRLILDQCYEISRLKNKCELVILSSRPSEDIPTFEKREQNLIHQYGVKITYMPGSRFKQFTQIYLLIREILIIMFLLILFVVGFLFGFQDLYCEKIYISQQFSTNYLH